jgi:hypothetical protein
LGDVSFTKILSRAHLIMRTAAQGDIPNVVPSRPSPRIDVIELDKLSRITALSAR